MNIDNKIHFLGYSGSNPAKDIKDGFIASGPYYGQFDDKCRACKSANIPIVVRIGADLNFLGKDEWKEVDENSVDKEITDQIAKYLFRDEDGSKLDVYAWSIHPEELRPWRKNEMNYLMLVKRIIRRFSDKPVIAYIPNNRDSYHISTLIDRGVEIVGRNAYIKLDPKENRTKIIHSIQEVNRAIESKKDRFKQLTTAIYLQLAMDPSNSADDSLIEKIVRHDVFLSVVCGAKCVIIWSLFKRQSVKRTYDRQYNAYKSAIDEINNKEISLSTELSSKLAEIFLNSKKKIVHSSDLLYTYAEYEISVTSKFVIHLNSSNLKKEIPNGCCLEAFEVKYGVETDEIKLDFNEIEVEKETKHTISDALDAFKIIKQVLSESENFEESDNNLLSSLKDRLDRETAFESLDKLKERLDQEA